MTRLSYLFFCATCVAGVALVGCGGGSSGGSGGSGGGGSGSCSSTSAASFLSLVPGNNTISGWALDSSNPKTAGQTAATATTEADVETLIDGAAADFFASTTPQNFAWQNYINPNLLSAYLPTGGFTGDGSTLKLYILQMPSADQATSLYTSLLSANLYTSNTWEDPTSPTIGCKSRITDSGTDWWVNFADKNYYVEVRLMPSYSNDTNLTPKDPGQKKAAMDFAAAIASKI